MQCQHTVELDGLRPGTREDQEALANHLRTCAACSKRMEEHAALDGLLRTTMVAEPPRELSDRLAAAARLAARRPVAAHPPTPIPAPAVYRDTGRSGWLAVGGRWSVDELVVVALLLGMLAAFVLDAVGVGIWLGLLRLGGESLVAVQVVLASPAIWIVPDPTTFLVSFASWAALGLIVWLALGTRSAVPQRARRFWWR